MKDIIELGVNFVKVLIGSLMNPHAMITCIVASMVFLVSVFIWCILFSVYTNSANKLITTDIFRDLDYNDKKVKRLYIYDAFLLILFYIAITSLVVSLLSGLVVLANI